MRERSGESEFLRRRGLLKKIGEFGKICNPTYCKFLQIYRIPFIMYRKLSEKDPCGVLPYDPHIKNARSLRTMQINVKILNTVYEMILS